MRVLALTGIVAGVAYVFTPLTASGRPGPADRVRRQPALRRARAVIGLALLPLVPALRRRPWPWVLMGLFGAARAPGDVPPRLRRRLRDRPLAELEVRPPGRVAGAGVLLRRLCQLRLVAAARAGVAAGRWRASASPRWSRVVLGRTQQEQYLRRPLRGRRRPAARGRLPLDAAVDAAAGVRQERPSDARIGVVGRGLRLRPVLLLRRRPLQLRPVPGQGAAPRHLPPDRGLQ